MTVSRRGLMLGGLAAGAAPPLVGSGAAEAAQSAPQGSPGDQILKLFAGLPRANAIKVDAPATRTSPGLHVSYNAAAGRNGRPRPGDDPRDGDRL